MTLSQVTLFLFTNLHFNHLLLVTVEEVLIMVEVVDVADIVEEVHMVGVEEEETSKLTAKVGKFKHLLSLLPKRNLLHLLTQMLHFMTQMRHSQLNILQTSQIILKFKVSCIIQVKRKPHLTLQVAIS